MVRIVLHYDIITIMLLNLVQKECWGYIETLEIADDNLMLLNSPAIVIGRLTLMALFLMILSMR